MLTYLIILLDDTSTSYCHYDVAKTECRLISLDDLRAGILFAMKENLNIQFVYPNYELPTGYQELIESIDHIKIKPESQICEADVIVLDNWRNCNLDALEGRTCIIRTNLENLKSHCDTVKKLLARVVRLNIVFTDIEMFNDNDIQTYQNILLCLGKYVLELYRKGHMVQLNTLTDRIMLSEMNNCNAGYNNVTLAPNGKFYLCPAFYYNNEQNCVGSPNTGINIKNKQLLRLDHAPICRRCDSFQCKRCIWLNAKLTMDANTPSRQQCVIAHLERNASCYLLTELDKAGIKINNSQFIEEITELDPFNIVNVWK